VFSEANKLQSVTLCLNPTKCQFMRCATARRLGQLDNNSPYGD